MAGAFTVVGALYTIDHILGVKCDSTISTYTLNIKYTTNQKIYRLFDLADGEFTLENMVLYHRPCGWPFKSKIMSGVISYDVVSIEQK